MYTAPRKHLIYSAVLCTVSDPATHLLTSISNGLLMTVYLQDKTALIVLRV